MLIALPNSTKHATAQDEWGEDELKFLLSPEKPPNGTLDQAMIRWVMDEWDRCADDHNYFINQYCYIYDSLTRDWINFDLWPMQAQMIDIVHNNQRVLALKARQVGFTWICLSYPLWNMLYHPEYHLLLFSLRSTEANALIERLRGMLTRLPWWMQPQSLLTDHISRIEMSSSSDVRAFKPDAGDSYTASFALIDEADLIRYLERLIARVMPTVEAGGKLVMIGRSDENRTNTEFKRLYKDARQGLNDYVTAFIPWFAHPLRDQAWYEAQKRSYAKDTLFKNYPATEDEALSRSEKGKIYPAFALANMDERAEYDPTQPLYWFVDDGYSNPRVVLFFQDLHIPELGERMCVIDEYYQNERTSEQALMELKQGRYARYKKPEIVYHDPSAAEFAAVCVLPPQDGQNRWGDLSTWGAFNNVFEGIKVVRRCIVDGNGVRRLLINPRCVMVKKEMEDYHEKDTGEAGRGGDMQPVKEDDHAPDALRYGLATRYLHLIGE